MGLTLEIVTPESRAYNSTVDTVSLPTELGEIGVLPGHIPLLASVEAGEVVVQKNGEIEHLAVDAGFAQVFGDKVSILTEQAIDIDHTHLDQIEEAKDRAEAALVEAKELGIDPKEIERLESIARFAMVQELIKKKRG
jgi:F-type H+-transporting ATPase subunit epsilon